ncbi:carbamoyl phosphate synthase small subunit [Siminovitchia acidinfaciens]|nr:carbamoyl phosphate synthase small subunit [Siminovitchia acidinfaciens]
MEGSLILANGEIFTGKWHGRQKDHIGELIFFTGMGRFQEFITDPANQGKIVIATFPGILNSDLDHSKSESDKIQIGGLISQQDVSLPMNSNGKSVLDIFSAQNIPILSGMDTRALIKRVKTDGEMPAVISSGHKANRLDGHTEAVVAMSGTEYVVQNGNKHIVIINFGYKKSLIQAVSKFGNKVTVVSNHIDMNLMNSLQPDGLIFSGGAGDPMQWHKFFPQYKQLAMKYPTIGLGLGHQILALSFGATVEKMPTGHRNFKEAVIHTESKKVFMSSQNHGYAVNEKDLIKRGLRVSFKNVHDGTVEGLEHEQYPLATYQFHPEQINNPLNELIFNNFFQTVNESKGARIYA